MFVKGGMLYSLWNDRQVKRSSILLVRILHQSISMSSKDGLRVKTSACNITLLIPMKHRACLRWQRLCYSRKHDLHLCDNVDAIEIWLVGLMKSLLN